jgi:hypothetical protein
VASPMDDKSGECDEEISVSNGTCFLTTLEVAAGALVMVAVGKKWRHKPSMF